MSSFNKPLDNILTFSLDLNYKELQDKLTTMQAQNTMANNSSKIITLKKSTTQDKSYYEQEKAKVQKALEAIANIEFETKPPTGKVKSKTQFLIRVPGVKEDFYINQACYETLTALWDYLKLVNFEKVEYDTEALQKLANQANIAVLMDKLEELQIKKEKAANRRDNRNEMRYLSQIIEIEEQIERLKSGNDSKEQPKSATHSNSTLEGLKQQLREDEKNLAKLQQEKTKAKNEHKFKLELEKLQEIMDLQESIKEIQLEINSLTRKND